MRPAARASNWFEAQSPLPVRNHCAPTAADYAAAAAAPRRDPSAAAAAPRYDTSAFAADKSRKAKEARGGDAGRMIFGDAEGADEDV